MKLTVKQALEMFQALGQLDSYQNGAEKPTLYKYGGDIRLQLAIARRKLREIQEDYVEARNKLLMEITDGVGELPTLPSGPERAVMLRKHVEFAKREEALLEAEVDVDIKPIPAEALKLDENPIPLTVLDLLGDMMQA